MQIFFEKMIVDLTTEIGIPLLFNTKTLETYLEKSVREIELWKKTLNSNELWKSLKIGAEYTNAQGNTIKEPDLSKYRNPSDSILYCGKRGVYWDNKDLWKLINDKKIRLDVTALHAGTIGNEKTGNEYIRTEGHEHLSGLPEIYETVYGKNGYLLFKPTMPRSEDIEDVFFVFAEKGDHVLFPPGYQHISVNIGEEGFLMTNWVSTEARTDFSYIKKHNGTPYWVVCKGNKVDFERNPKYKRKVPKIRKVEPAEVVELSHGVKIRKGEPMFNLVKDGKIEALDFLNDSSDKYFYKQAFIDF